MESRSICFVGAGNMAEAILAALLAKGQGAAQLMCVDVRQERLDELAGRHSVRVSRDLASAREAEVIFLAVKPKDLGEVANELGHCLAEAKDGKERLVISIAAGVELAFLRERIPGGAALVRAMPNLAIAVGHGMTALFAEADCPADSRRLAQELFEAGGAAVWLDDEEDMHLVTAVSGSGPGFVFDLLERMVEAATRLGLKSEDAKRMVIAAALGAATMAADSPHSLAELCRRVTSPGGTTAAGLERLEKGDLAELFEEVFASAAARSRELAGKGCGKDGDR